MKKLLAAILVLNLALFSGSLLADGKKDKGEDHDSRHEHSAGHDGEHGKSEGRGRGKGHDKDHSNETGRHHGRGHREHDHEIDDDDGGTGEEPAMCVGDPVTAGTPYNRTEWTFDVTLSGLLCTTTGDGPALDQLQYVLGNYNEFVSEADCIFDLITSDQSDYSNLNSIEVVIELFDCRVPS